METDESRAWWRAYAQRQSLLGTDIAVRCGVEPKRHRRLAGELTTTLDRLGIVASSVAISPGLGTALFRFAWDGAPGSVRTMAAAIAPVAETFTVLRSPPEAKREVDVWGSMPESVGVMRALKAEYDPKRTLNPGRFIDRL
jgi:glycolate oxidase FAD binding subunit